MTNVTRRLALVREGHIDRLDAEFHSSPLIGHEFKAVGAGGRPLSDLCDISDERKDPAAFGSGEFQYLDIGGVDPRDGFVLSQVIGRAQAPSRARIVLRQPWIALSSVRPARNAVALITEDLDDSIGSTGFIPLKPRAIDPLLLFAFLKTRFARAQFARRARASMYPLLYPPDALRIVVPSFPAALGRSVIAEMKRALDARKIFVIERLASDAAASGYFDSMGNQTLVAEIETRRPQMLRRSNLLNAGGANRLDAEFYQPTFPELEARMRAVGGVRTLGELSSHVTSGATPAGSPAPKSQAHAMLLKVGSFTDYGIAWASATFVKTTSPIKADVTLMDGDVLFASTAHQPWYLARKAGVLRGAPSGWACPITYTGDVTRIRVADQAAFPPEYLAAFIRSAVGGEQIRRCIRGLSSHVYEEDLKRFVLVPEPPVSVREAVARHSASAQAARWAYREHALEAIHLLDEAVERSGIVQPDVDEEIGETDQLEGVDAEGTE